ncbi:exopolysaccharide biosynthesis protein [Brucella cytisi]|uniref:exopolysaccharide biosynthesis protein n=1 Tax=Brucella cytisi TaxID=407152 RepID=UPI0035D6642F
MEPLEQRKNAAHGIMSTIMTDLAREASLRDGLTVFEALELMGRSGFGFVLILLALPALIPLPGPFGMVFGTAVSIVSLQFMFGLQPVWLPSFLGKRKLSASALSTMERHVSPLVQRIERLVLPNRLQAIAGSKLNYIVAIPVFCLGIAIALPIPFGNMAPVAAILVISIGLVEKDGLVVLFGLGLTMLALAVTGGLVYALLGATTIV